MADYYPLIARAIAGLDPSAPGESRRALYERARAALIAQLRSVQPPLSESEITRERLSLEEAVRKVESEAAQRARDAARTGDASRPGDAARPGGVASAPAMRSVPPPAPIHGRAKLRHSLRHRSLLRRSPLRRRPRRSLPDRSPRRRLRRGRARRRRRHRATSG